MYKFILFFTIILVSGFIAFIGDNIGRKIGKKRISILNIRPKYTAIIITIVTGILISVISITILSLISQDVRTALFGLEQLKNELKLFSEELNVKTKELEEARLKLGNLTKNIREKEKKLEETNNKIEELEKIKKKMEEDLSEAFSLIETLRDEEKNLKSTISSLKEKIAELIQQRDGLTKEIDELNRTIKILRHGISMVREGRVIYYAGQQIAQTIVKGGQTREKIEQHLFNFLAYASEIAIKKGAKPDKKIGKVFFISKDQFKKVVDKIVSSKGKEFVVRLLAAFNVLEGEPIPTQIYAQENKLIFKKGDVIVEETIESSGSTQEIESKIFILLRRANAEAVEKGIIPDPEKGTVGIISVYNIYQTINKIKSYNGQVKVRVIATKDIWTSDKVRAEIVVEPINKEG